MQILLPSLNTEKQNQGLILSTSLNTEKQNQGLVPSPIILGHIISENELALASSHRKLNDVFDEFAELQQQNNKVSEKTSLKKFEKKSDVIKKNQNRRNKEEPENNRRGSSRKRKRKQKEIAERLLKSKSVVFDKVAGTSSDKNHIQRIILKNNKEEFGDDDKVNKKVENRVNFTKNCKDNNAFKANNDKVNTINMKLQEKKVSFLIIKLIL